MVGVDLAAHLQTGLGRRGADQLDNHCVADQRLAAPVLGNEGEQPMLYFIPFAGAWWQVGHRDRQTALIGEALQFTLSEFHPGAVAAVAVGGE